MATIHFPELLSHQRPDITLLVGLPGSSIMVVPQKTTLWNLSSIVTYTEVYIWNLWQAKMDKRRVWPLRMSTRVMTFTSKPITMTRVLGISGVTCTDGHHSRAGDCIEDGKYSKTTSEKIKITFLSYIYFLIFKKQRLKIGLSWIILSVSLKVML